MAARRAKGKPADGALANRLFAASGSLAMWVIRLLPGCAGAELGGLAGSLRGVRRLERVWGVLAAMLDPYAASRESTSLCEGL